MKLNRIWILAVLLLLTLLPVSGQVFKGLLITEDSVNEGKIVTYMPFLGDPFDLTVYHFNIGDPLPDSITEAGDFATDFYLFGTENNYFDTTTLEESDGEKIWQFGTEAFMDSVFGVLNTQGSFDPSFWQFFSSEEREISYNLLGENFMEFLSNPYANSIIFSPFNRRYVGYFFLPRETEIYLAEQGELDYEFDDMVTMTPAEAQTFLEEFEASASQNFHDWYDTAIFSEAYGLVTKNLTPEANKIRDYSLEVLTTPRKFKIEDLITASSDIIYLAQTDVHEESIATDSVREVNPVDYSGLDYDFETDTFSWVETTDDGYFVTSVDVTLGSRIEYFAELLQNGTIDNLYEAELFNVWFTTEYMLTDALPLWKYAESGQSALSLPQVVIDTMLSSSLAGNTILRPSRPAAAAPASSSTGGNAVMQVLAFSTNSPVANTAFTVFSIFGQPGTGFKTNAGYNFIFPQDIFEVSLDMNFYVNNFPYQDEEYVTIDSSIKGQYNFLKTRDMETHAFASFGITVNEGVLMANYINTSLGAYQDLKLYPLSLPISINAGAILSGKYWSQFPQLELKFIAAARARVDLTLLSVSVDAIYSRSLGALSDAEWSSYAGGNVNYLNLGVGANMYLGSAFSINAGLRKDFLMPNYSSIELSAGGGFVF